ncbi:DUF2975 domain-containing protein [Alteribacillus iranensis]|uniref:DUF2975 domain-containing protein n=1 Tax=Alteribacillus iranensis TaxID=930128 RepID=A0A1I2BRQ3_9BACI|nr:DUF2975 domain-containing protein [Alteribacillus iranensis]SFE58769.1 Protein of unknown function [Alteribacillus iranensis]
MKSPTIFYIGSWISLIFVYFVGLLGLFTTLEHASRLWFPDSALASTFGRFEPIFGSLDVRFTDQPALYAKDSFIALSFVSNITVMILAALVAWYLHKLLRNIYRNSLFMFENVSIFYKLGFIILILGSAAHYIDGMMVSQAIRELAITNAFLTIPNLFYIDTVVAGVFLILLASALNVAVKAVEENRQTI